MTSLAQGIVEKTLNTVGENNTTIARELLTTFFQEVRDCEQGLPVLLEQKNFKLLAMTLHKLAGACGYFGATQLRDELLQAEATARKNQLVDLELQLYKLAAILQITANAEPEVFAKLV